MTLAPHPISSLAIYNVRVVLPDGIIENGAVRIADGTIEHITDGVIGQARTSIDGKKGWLLPGLVDLHGDALESAIAPRPAAPFRVDQVMPSYDATLAVNGITTMYHCVAVAELGELTKPLRYRHKVKDIVEAIHRFRPTAQVRTHIHLRYEILDTESIELVRELVKTRKIDLLSLMDHTPGFGVFPDIEAYRQYIRRSGGNLAAADQTIAERLKLRENVDQQAIDALIRLCHQCEIPIASHDDHTEAKIDRAYRHGIEIAEFPVTIEAVQAARDRGMHTVFGAANLVRGVSHAGNLKASDMVAQDLVDIVVSDYAPMSLLQGLFKARKISHRPFHELVHLFTRNPARAVKFGHRIGEITVGHRADLILLDQATTVPRVSAAIVDGQPIYLGAGTALN
jgi:alpha-D-ribose 1-methylphosphonate 5-triphosphate diphosphatase